MVFKPAHLVLFDSYTFMSVSMEDEERLYIVAWESVHLDQICICTVRDQICICTVRMANEWEKNVNTLLDFFILFFFFYSAFTWAENLNLCSRQWAYFLMSTFFLINCWKTSCYLFMCLVYCNFMYYHLLEWSFYFYLRKNLGIFLCSGEKKKGLL